MDAAIAHPIIQWPLACFFIKKIISSCLDEDRSLIIGVP